MSDDNPNRARDGNRGRDHRGWKGGLIDELSNSPSSDRRPAADPLVTQADQSGKFADSSELQFGRLGLQGRRSITALRGLTNGEQSLSSEQLRQGLQQNLAAQQVMVAGAAPQNTAMAQRVAALQGARVGTNLMGQQAAAGFQERNQAQQALAQMINAQRQQSLQAALGSRTNTIYGLGSAKNPGEDKSWSQAHGAEISGLSGALAAYAQSQKGK